MIGANPVIGAVSSDRCCFKCLSKHIAITCSKIILDDFNGSCGIQNHQMCSLYGTFFTGIKPVQFDIFLKSPT